MATMPANRTAVDKLKKAEVIELLKELREPAPTAWTAEELRAKLKGALFSDQTEGPKKHLRRLGQKTKVELQAICEELGAPKSFLRHTTTHMLKGDLMVAVRAKVRELSTPMPGDTLDFGKHKEKTYKQVLEAHSQYCTWVKKAAATEDTPGRELTRFASWLNMLAAGATPEAAAEDEKGSTPRPWPTPPQPNSGAASSSGSRAATSTKTGPSPETEKIRQELEQMKKAMADLTGSQRPRKIPAKEGETPMEISIATPDSTWDTAIMIKKMNDLTAKLQELEEKSVDQRSEADWARVSQASA